MGVFSRYRTMTDTQNAGASPQGSYGSQVTQAAAMLKARQVSQANGYQGQSGTYQPTQRPQQAQDPSGLMANHPAPDSMEALTADHTAAMQGFQQRAQAMMAVHQAFAQRSQAAQRQAQLQALGDNQGATDGLQRMWAMQDRAGGF